MSGLTRDWRAVGAELRVQWRANARLRFGVLLIIGIIWFWALLMVLDEAKPMREQALSIQAEIDQLEPLLMQTRWPARVEEARALLDAARQLQWVATSQGAAEARLQDTLRALCAKAGIAVVELVIVQGSAAAGMGAGAPLRVRLVTEFNRQTLLNLLGELQGMKPVVMVDAFRLRPAMVPARAEMEIRVQMRVQDGAREEKS